MGLFSRRAPDSRKARLPQLTAIPPMADLPKPRLQAPARYLGTVTEEGEKVTGQTLSVKSSARLHLSAVALDVVRIAGSFRIPVAAMRGATASGGFDGKPVDSLLVVRWEHGEQQWRTGFRLESGKNLGTASGASDSDQWVRTISKMSRKSVQGQNEGEA